MAKRTLAVATWEYAVGKGKYRRAYFGDEIDVPAAEIKRGEAAGVFAPKAKAAPTPAKTEPDPAAVEPVEPAVVEDGDVLEGLDESASAGDAEADPVEAVRPKNAAPHEEWVAFAVANGMDREEAEATDRADLIKALS